MIELKAQTREILGKKVKKLRKAGFIPAVLYGPKRVPHPLSVNEKEFLKILKEVGETTLISLRTTKNSQAVLVHDLERHPLTSQILHVDFYQVDMAEKIKVKVPLVFTGESPAVKSQGGVLIRSLSEIEVEALPADLPREIAVDISGLGNFEDKIHVGDLKVGPAVKILIDPKEMVASLAPPRSEQELEELKSKPEEKIEEVAVAGQPKEEGAGISADADKQL